MTVCSVRGKVAYEFDVDVQRYLKKVEKMDRLGVFQVSPFKETDLVLRRYFVDNLVEDIKFGRVTLENVKRLVYSKHGNTSVPEVVRDRIVYLRNDLLLAYADKYC